MSIRIQAPRFDLRHTLECGQFFRWTRHGDAFHVQRGRRLFRVRQTGVTLDVQGADRWFIRDFFSLDHDLAGIEHSLRRDPRLRPALDAYPGLRLIRQDPWECTAAFIISIASNIPRITRNVADIARTWGRRIALGDFTSNEFPRPGEFGSEESLRRLRLGFRARYLDRAARLAESGLLEEIPSLSCEDAREALMVIPGVAEKVADCILLFAFGRLEAFPVDTWIRRVMIDLYFHGRRVPDRAIRAFASERWGDLAGYAQQYLYTWSRARGRVSVRAPRAASRA